MRLTRYSMACMEICLVLGLSRGVGANRYRVAVDLGKLAVFGATGMAMNDSAEATGYAYDTPASSYVFRYTHGVIEKVPNLAGNPIAMVGLGIDNSGNVSGTATYAGYYRGFYFNGSSSIDIGSLAGGPSTYTAVRGMSPLGLVVGESYSAVLGATHAIEYSSGVMTDLGAIDNNNQGPLSSAAWASNRTGGTSGASASPLGTTHAILISSYVVQDLAANDTFTTSIGYAVNSAGDVVGQRGPHAALFKSGIISDLGTLGGGSSTAYGIDDKGIIVGKAQRGDGAFRAFLRDSAGMHDLNELCDSSNLNLSEARVISSQGWILANGTSGSSYILAPASPTGVENENPQSLPTAFELEQNYPNPFNPTTAVSYHVPTVSDVRLIVYDLLGREVAVLVNEKKAAGSYKVHFDASELASGMYLCRLEADDFVQTRKLLLLK